jgi:hypothetical protein
MNTAIEENRRSFANLADSNEIQRSVPDTVRQKTSVFICVARLKKVLIELFRHPASLRAQNAHEVYGSCAPRGQQ